MGQIYTRAILTMIRAKCEKCWGAEKCNGAYHWATSNGGVSVRMRDATDVWLRTRVNHFSSHAKVLTSRRRSVREEIAGQREREREKNRVFPPFFIFSFFANFFSFHIFSPSFAHSRSGLIFPPPRRNRSSVTPSPFVSHAKALITLFRVGRRSRGY